MNPDPFQHWHGVKKHSQSKDKGGELYGSLGTMVPRSTPSGLSTLSDHSLQMGLITNLLGAEVACVGLGNAYMRPLGYIIIQVQVDGVEGYDEDQIALVIMGLI